MVQKNQPLIHKLLSQKLLTRMATGLLIGLAVISCFIFPVPHPRAEWGTFWRVRPLIVTPIAGMMCGACFHIISSIFQWFGWNKVVGVIMSFVIYVVGLWLGTVLGLAGTLWD